MLVVVVVVVVVVVGVAVVVVVVVVVVVFMMDGVVAIGMMVAVVEPSGQLQVASAHRIAPVACGRHRRWRLPWPFCGQT